MKQFNISGHLFGEPINIISTKKGCEHFVRVTKDYFGLDDTEIKQLNGKEDLAEILKYWSL